MRLRVVFLGLFYSFFFAFSQVLLRFSVPRRRVLPFPLASIGSAGNSFSFRMCWFSVGCVMLLLVKFKRIKKKTKKILKAVPCQRATNLFDVGLKASIFIKRKRKKKIWRNFLLDLEQKKQIFWLGYFENYLHMTPCELLNFAGEFLREIYDLFRSLYNLGKRRQRCFPF